MLVSKNKLAELLGVNAQSVQNWKRRGWLRMNGTKVEYEKTLAVLAERAPLQRRDKPRDDETPADAAARVVIDDGNVFPSIKLAQLYRESYVAKLKQIEFDLAVGTVVKKADVETVWIAKCRVARNALLSIPARVAPRLLKMTDANKVKSIIEGEIFEALEGLSNPRG
jgi:phage terminase Nu1 subunit (DNA packaging protein)